MQSRAWWCALLAACSGAAHGAGLTEKDFLGEIPVVFTVSRLSQPLNEAPGAVTVIDREFIRRSGARELVDVLRFVPGFQVTYARGGNGLGNYHGAYFDHTSRMQVLIDGRSVYSVHYVGSTAFGARTVALDDIERIEILRGSNAANYGARAFLGVINVVTRDPRDTRGVSGAVAMGEDGLGDAAARIGWGDERRAFRLSADTRGDRGLAGVPDANRLRNVNFRGDLRLDGGDELELRGGVSEQSVSDGYTGSAIDPPRRRRYYGSFVQADWRRPLGAEEEVSIHASLGDERFHDHRFIALPAPFLGVDLDFGGRGRVASIAANHRFPFGGRARLSWGAEVRSEANRSAPLFNRGDWIDSDFVRLYGNVEWRLDSRWVLNAGAMLEESSSAGGALMPRAMLNWLVTPAHTLRAGASAARRTPSTFERAADQRLIGADGSLVDWFWRGRGSLQPEELRSVEAGWHGEFRSAGVTADARLFRERIHRFLEYVLEPLPPGTELSTGDVQTFVNGRALEVDGLEYEAAWRPAAGTQLRASQAFLRPRAGAAPSLTSFGVLSMPRSSTALAWLQKLPGGLEGTLAHLRVGAMSWSGDGGTIPAWRRTDLRIGYPFRVGATRAEVALVVQNLGDRAYTEFLPPLESGQRAWLTLRAEM